MRRAASVDRLDWSQHVHSWPNSPLSTFVRAGGIDWHVQRCGSGPALLLVHGTGASTHSWRDMLPNLAHDFDVVAMDLPGHGFTSAAPHGMSIQQLGVAVRALLDELEFEPQIAVGHSAGAAIIARMSLDAQLDVRLIVGINAALLPMRGAAAPLFSTAAKLLTRLRFWRHWISYRARRGDLVRRLLGDIGSPLDAEGVELYQRLACSPAHVGAALRMMADWDLGSLRRALPQLSAPLVLIVGGRDRAVPPKDAERVARIVATTTIVEIHDGGHLVHEERPTTTIEAVRKAIGDCFQRDVRVQ